VSPRGARARAHRRGSAPWVSGAGSPWLEPDVFRDERRGLWIAVRPASSFIVAPVVERRAIIRRRTPFGGWTPVDTFVVVLVAIFYGALGYVLWQLGCH
jgi:hypothetical protein